MPEIKRILCPVDFSEASRHAVEQAVAIAPDGTKLGLRRFTFAIRCSCRSRA